MEICGSNVQINMWLICGLVCTLKIIFGESLSIRSAGGLNT